MVRKQSLFSPSRHNQLATTGAAITSEKASSTNTAKTKISVSMSSTLCLLDLVFLPLFGSSEDQQQQLRPVSFPSTTSTSTMHEEDSSTKEAQAKDPQAEPPASHTSLGGGPKSEPSPGNEDDRDRIANYFAMAKLLRDCAELVERGGFDSILCQAVQDFRTRFPNKISEQDFRV
jgi:hypothetical protein